MAGGPSTPELAAAVSKAGGLGFLAAGYLSATALAEKIEQTRALTSRPFGVNLFVPGPRHAPDTYAGVRRRTSASRSGTTTTGTRSSRSVRDVPVVSFTFGCPAPRGAQRARADVGDRDQAGRGARGVGRGASAVIVQGAEAGGHRGSWVDEEGAAPIGLIALLQTDRRAEDRDRRDRDAGGRAGRPQARRRGRAGRDGVHARARGGHDARARRAARRRGRRPALTRAFSGRLARGIRNRFMAEHENAPIAYPEIHYATSKLRADAARSGDSDGFNLWAGQAYPLAQARPAGEITRWLAGARGEARVEHELRAGDVARDVSRVPGSAPPRRRRTPRSTAPAAGSPRRPRRSPAASCPPSSRGRRSTRCRRRWGGSRRRGCRAARARSPTICVSPVRPHFDAA